MMNKSLSTIMLACASIMVVSVAASAQGTVEDYNRAYGLASRFSQDKVLNTVQRVQWTENGTTLYYQTNTANGPVFVSVNAEKGTRKTYTSQADLNKALGIKQNAPAVPSFPQRGFTPSKFEPQEPHWATVDEEKDMFPVTSPDGKTEAYVQNCNIVLHSVGTPYSQDKIITRDGTLGNYYSNRLIWSPDGKYIFACRRRPVDKRYVYFVESSPAGQTQPLLHQLEYAKPGDDLPQFEPVIIEVATGKQTFADYSKLANQYELGFFQWTKDSKEVTMEYNQRSHKLYQMLAMDAQTGKLRTIVEEKAETFVNWTRIYRHFNEDGNEILWTSERDNWNHLYLVDLKGGIKQITKGDWCVRDIVNVDEKNRKITFTASGMNPQEDPYLIHYYTINFDGTNLVSLTPANGTHRATFSPDGKYIIDTYSLVDQAPVTELRSAKDGKLIATLEKADISALKSAGWIAPERFVAPGRDGKTPMYGIIIRPTNFDPAKKYPIIEYIYSGPGDAYTRKDFRAYDSNLAAIAELGFIVVQLDGMGTSWRGKKFEEICYKKLNDAGFLDRKAWIRAAAQKYPYMDADNVGIYGSSAGGQEAAAAVLFHGDFYKAAYSACGCHDNRMDKIWWNEQWMGYPIDEAYEECSNVVNAYRLDRPLMLVVGELDDNVDPASTMQVVDALEKAGKDFELVVITGAKHTMGGTYGEHKRYDFFVRELLGVKPPKWSDVKSN